MWSTPTLSQTGSSLLPLSQKKRKGLSINDPSKASNDQNTNLWTFTSRGKKERKHIAKKQVNIHSKLVSPSQDTKHASCVLPTIAPRALNKIKADGEWTILKEHRLSTDGVISEYPAIWRQPNSTSSKSSQELSSHTYSSLFESFMMHACHPPKLPPGRGT
ncbi:hypothetical protein KY285_034356 [Solanum tuberosum]|uniref:Uncharacterized protein n=1 Tax=Solanum tuberosum TaxID=4113 RepID=M1DT05_SOLTU|nr:hypothetical protein KY284_034315 [Solanum tuberosum]KAH0649108.1 hypothetical protein KY285_034356 [Solanum tuberosum]